jgi:hypothetical protein
MQSTNSSTTAAEPINPVDLSALKTKIATRRNELEGKIRASVANLQQASSFVIEQRKKLSALANQTFAALKQAEANEQRASGPLHKASQFISICCAVLAGIGLLQSGGQPKRTASTNNPPIATGEAKPPIWLEPRPPIRSEPKPPISRPPIQKQPSLPPTPKMPPNENASNSNEPPTSNVEEPKKEVPPPFPPIQEVPRLPDVGTVEPQNYGPTKDISVAADAMEIQLRLVALGFLTGPADGRWGAQSKLALFNYKQHAGLENNDLWDAITERSLFSSAAPRVARTYSFIGGWTEEKGQCGTPGGSAPMRMTSDHAETDGGRCKFNSVQPDGNNSWRIDAICTVIGEGPHSAHIHLTIQQDVMQWSSEQPTTFYYRCGKVQ